MIDNKTYLEAAAGILAVEAYHAGIVRTALYSKGLQKEVRKLSAARDSLDGKSNDDRGIGRKKTSNLVPTDRNGLAYGTLPGAGAQHRLPEPEQREPGRLLPQGRQRRGQQKRVTAMVLQSLAALVWVVVIARALMLLVSPPRQVGRS